MGTFVTRERGLIARADGGIPTSTARALYVPPSMSAHVGAVHYRFGLGYGRIQNRSGATAACGFAARAHVTQWLAGQLGGGGQFDDDTADAQDVGTDDFPLAGLGLDSGFWVACRQPFNLLAILVSTAQAGAPTYAMEYSQSGGTWGTITNLLAAPSFTATGESLIWWAMPPDWAVLESGHGTGAPTGYYGVRMRVTVVPATAPVATSLSVFEAIQARENVTDNTVFEFAPARTEHKFGILADSLYGVVNDVTALYSIAQAEVKIF